MADSDSAELAVRHDTAARDTFVQLLISAQPWLFSYLVTLLGNIHDADNVLQETNVHLWSKADAFRPGTNFRAWAREFAYHCALSFTRDRKRERLIIDFNLLESVISQTDTQEIDPKRIALRHCLTELDDQKVELLRQRYRDETPISAIAEKQHKTEAAIKMSLRRVRMALMKCIETRIATAP
jgi:RNA polymerase sigma-70 factor (ECF subfamily)